MEETREHPDIFRADPEAWRYLKLPSKRSFDKQRRAFGIRGKKVGRQYIYSREQLDAMRLKMFGMDGPKSRKN